MANSTHSDAASEFSDFLVPSVHSDDDHSDSDWLDIASNREEAVSDREDHDNIQAATLSRRSSMSFDDSSRDGGDTDHWDGFTDDEHSDAGSAMPDNVADLDSPIMGPVTVDNDDDNDEPFEEEQRLLDQSMYSTLSRSSSRPSTVHNSLRDLRLSFPDPLTSSGRTSLSSSFDNVQSIEGTPMDTVAVVEAPVAKEQAPNPTALSPALNGDFPLVPNFTFAVSGAPHPLKAAFILKFLEKAFGGNGMTLTGRSTHGQDAWYHFTCVQEAAVAESSTVLVRDDADVGYPCNARLVFLPDPGHYHWGPPAIFISLPDAQGAIDDTITQVMAGRRDHFVSWNSLDTTFDASQWLASEVKVAKNVERGAYFTKLFVAFALIVAGGLLGRSMSTSTMPTVFPAGRNITTSLGRPAPSSLLSVSQTRSLSVYSNPTKLSSSEERIITISEPSTSMSLITIPTLTKDLIFSPPSTPSSSVQAGETMALNVRAVDSLSIIAEVAFKSVMDLVAKDMRDLLVALDDLTRAIRRQTESSLCASKTLAQKVLVGVHYRHERAKDRAKSILSSVGAAFGTKARSNAHAVKDLIAVSGSEVWRSYQEAQGEWAGALRDKARRRSGKAIWA